MHLADGRDTFLEFRERLRAAATETMYLDAAGELVPDAQPPTATRRSPFRAPCSASTRCSQRTARMTREQVMAPAIALAERGLRARAGRCRHPRHAAPRRLRPEPNVAAIFLNGRQALEAGERLVQSELAATLRADRRRRARRLLQGRHRRGGRGGERGQWRHPDQAGFRRLHGHETPPVRCTYRGYDIVSAPPPSSGGTTICQILNILEGYPMAELGFHSAAGSPLSWSRRCATPIVDRNIALGDPDFVDNPLDAAPLQGLRRQHPREDRSGQGRGTRRTRARRAAARGHRDDALLDRRQGRQRRGGDLHDQRLFRRQGDRWRYRLLPQ